VKLLLDAGISLVQLREKRGSGAARFESAREATLLAKRAAARLVVNDRADVTLLAGADGVHLGEEDLPPLEVRSLLGPGVLVGVSTHSAARAREAMQEDAASYVAIGPVFATRSKETSHAPLGLRAIEGAALGKRKPLVVIGGITPDLVGACLSAGADCVAMISGLLDGDARENVERAAESALSAGFAGVV
jgi:thiamine-phosphate pyrophosphorylase